MSGIFDNKIFYLFGRFDSPRKEIYEKIESVGGKIQHDVDGEHVPDYCIVQEYANSLNEYIQKVIDAEIPILKVGFVNDSINNSQVEDLDQYKVEPRPMERSELPERRFGGDRRGGRGGRGGGRGFRGGDRRGGRGGFRGGRDRPYGEKRSRDFDNDRSDFKRNRRDYEDRSRGSYDER